MKSWRLGFTLLLSLLVGVPLALPYLALARSPQAWLVLLDSQRLAVLTRNTLLVMAGTLVLAVPTGVLLACFLHRTNLPGRGLLRWLLLLSLFVPLPLFASGWQAALGSGGWLALPSWTTTDPSDPDVPPTGIAWKPWAQGIRSAAWIHAVAALPWVVLLVGLGLGWVERELEEDALTMVGPWRVLWKVTLPRARAAIGAACVWVALQTATEITVTDMFQVRTFAEEVYNQFMRPEADAAAEVQSGVAGAVAASAPMTLAALCLVLAVAWRVERNLPPLDRLASSPVLFDLRRYRWPCLIGLVLLCGLLVGIPVGSLVWKAGLSSRQTWSMAILERHLATILRIRGGLVVKSLIGALGAGILVAALALMTCWLAAGRNGFRTFAICLVVVAWVLPGPVVGIGLKETLLLLLDHVPSKALAEVLYYGESPLPGLWAFVLRFYPAGVAILWPVVRLVPRELVEAARVEGARPGQELVWVVWPLTRGAWLRACLVVAILSLGELSASKIVETPGSQTFAHEVFTQMHFGVTNDLAALCLILFVPVAAGSALIGLLASRSCG